MLHLAYLDFSHRYAIQRLRQQRGRLIAEVNAAFDEYVAVRDTSDAAQETQHIERDGGDKR